MPKEPGEYEFVCTYPGHYLIMWGKLIVTKDVDAYLQANPAQQTRDAHRRSPPARALRRAEQLD